MHEMLKGIPLPDSREMYDLVSVHNEKYNEVFITERARADAVSNIPSQDASEPAPFEKQMQHDASILASKIATQYRKSLEILDASIKAEEARTGAQHQHSVQKIEEHSQFSNQSIDQSSKALNVRKQLALAEERYNKLYDKHERAPIKYIPEWLYIILAILIFAGEIPLNALVFQIFGENQVMTWVMAVIIGLAVPLSAHFIGIKFREHPEKINWANLVKGTVALLVICSALYGLSVMRQTYLGEFKESLGLTDTLVKSSFMFFWLNIAVLGAAIMIAYMSHDPVPGFQKAEHDLLIARKLAAKLDKGSSKDRLNSRYQKLNMIKDSNKELRDGGAKTTMLKGYYDMILKEGQEMELQCLHGLRHDSEIYRRENLHARADKSKPKSFDTNLSLELRLNQIKEKLEN